MERRLAAILAADVVDYSRLMGEDQSATLAALRQLRETIFAPAVREHRGNLIKSMGDGWIVEFPSISDAVSCAIAVQESLKAGDVIRLRMGVHIGEVVFEAEDVFGEGVNVAARLEATAQPGEVVISDTAHHSLDGKIAALFEGGEVRELKNIARQVGLWHWPAKGNAAPTIEMAKSMRLPSPEVPSIAVLPFTIMTDDREHEYFADGLVDDIITSLSKLSGLRVIDRNSTFIYKRQAIDIGEVANKLRVQYVLEGSVRKSANRIRISAQLIDSASGSHIWAERYDRSITDIFAIQDEITMILATEMQVNLIEGEQARLRYTTTDNVEAWNHWVQGLAHYRREVKKENMEAARVCWQRALTLDPSSAPLNAMLSFIHYVDARFGWWDDKEVALSKVQAYIDRALELDPQNAQAYSVLGMASLIYRNFEEAAKSARRSIRLSPGSADVATFACFTLAFAGYADEAVTEGERATDLSPNCPPVYLGHLGNAYRLAGKFEKAITAFKAYHSRHAGFGLADLAIIYQKIGQPALSNQMVQQLMALRPDFTVEEWAKTQNRVDVDGLEADIASLCAAGFPMH